MPGPLGWGPRVVPLEEEEPEIRPAEPVPNGPYPHRDGTDIIRIGEVS
jgi:hypothetical protein